MDRSTRAPALVFALAAGAFSLMLHSGRAFAQCAAPPAIATQSQCGGVLIGWSGPRLGTTFRIFRAQAHQSPVVIGTDTASPFLDTTAEPGVTYQYYVQQFGGICGTTSPPAGPADGISGTPGAPSGLTAEDGVSCDAIHVSWNASTFATSYEVFRSTTAVLLDAVMIGTTSGTSFSDLTAKYGAPYWYWVRGQKLACPGPFQAAGEPGSLKLRYLPDLVLDEDLLSAVSHVVFDDGHHELLFTTGVANVGNAPLSIVPVRPRVDGSKEFVQIVLDCGGRTVNRSLGRFDVKTASDAVTFPHFLRMRLRKRLANGNAGDAVAMADLPATCVHDGAVFDSTIPGWPSVPSYPGCVVQARGLSVGWGVEYSLGSVGQALQLHCVPDGMYWLEATVDPDDMLEELDETNNTIRHAITFSGLPTPQSPPCTAPTIVGRLLGPDTLYAAGGLPSDTITARVWAAEVTDPPGEQTAIGSFAQIGYAPVDAFNATTGTPGNPWIWSPADYFRQDGAEEVYGASLAIQNAGDYFVAYRFIDIAAIPTDVDFDGSINGFSIDQTTLLRVRSTTGVGDAPESGVALALDALTNAATRTTRFRVGLPSAATVTVALYDVRGRRVRALEHGPRPAGEFVLEWDGRDQGGARAASGIYLARLETSAGGRLNTKFFAIAR